VNGYGWSWSVRACCGRNHCVVHLNASSGRSERLVSKALSRSAEDFYYAAKVHAGFTPRLKRESCDAIAKHPLRTCPFKNLPNSNGRSRWGEGITAEDMSSLRWVKPTVVVEVGFVEWTQDGLLRHARFLGRQCRQIAASGSSGVVVTSLRTDALPVLYEFHRERYRRRRRREPLLFGLCPNRPPGFRACDNRKVPSQPCINSISG
jgi:hypothetical protein